MYLIKPLSTSSAGALSSKLRDCALAWVETNKSGITMAAVAVTTSLHRANPNASYDGVARTIGRSKGTVANYVKERCLAGLPGRAGTVLP